MRTTTMTDTPTHGPVETPPLQLPAALQPVTRRDKIVAVFIGVSLALTAISTAYFMLHEYELPPP